MDVFLVSFSAAFATLFIVIDPIMVTPIFATLTAGDTSSNRFKTAIAAAIWSAGILGFFGVGGNVLLHHLGVSLDAFRAAMGAILFVMGYRMFFDPDSETQAKTPGPKASARENIAFFPLAMPMLAGPGGIATIMLMMGPGEPLVGKIAAFIAALAVLVIAVFMMAFASRIGDALGRTGMNAVTRLLGMILMALSTQYIFDGVRGGVLSVMTP